VTLVDREQLEAEEQLGALISGMSPDDLEAFAAQLDKSDLAMLQRVTAYHQGSGWRSDPLTLANRLDDRVRRWRYLQLLSDAFVRAVNGDSPRQIWNLPSRYGKTDLLRWGVVWGLDRAPMSRWIWTTYGDQLAHESAVWIRDAMREYSADIRAQLQADRQRADRFVTEQGGGVLGAGVNAAIIGFGCGDGGGLIIDDPMKNWQDAHSQAARNRVWDQYLGTLRHRLDQEEAPIIVCHARWHQDDLSGRLIEASQDASGEAFEVFDLAAIAEKGRDDPLGREPGEVLEEERFSKEAVLARHHAMGSYLAAGLEQQQPSSPEGSIIKRDWWQFYSVLPARVGEWLISVDTSFKDTSTADYCVLQVWARTGADFYLVHQIRDQMAYVAAKQAVKSLHAKYPQARRILIEDTANGPAIINDLTKDVPGLIARPAKGSKESRLHAVSGYIEAGNVYLPEGVPWLSDYVDELTDFPGVVNDDQVDATTQALLEWAKNKRRPRTATAAGHEPLDEGNIDPRDRRIPRGPRRRQRGRMMGRFDDGAPSGADLIAPGGAVRRAPGRREP